MGAEGMEVAGEELKTEVMDHLGLVAGVCQKLKIIERINARIGSKDPRRVVQPGMATVAMIINGLGFTNRRLYLTPQFFESKAVDNLLGKGVKAEHLDDHTLGKCLDEIAEYGVTKIFGEVVLEMMNENKLFDKVARLYGFH